MHDFARSPGRILVLPSRSILVHHFADPVPRQSVLAIHARLTSIKAEVYRNGISPTSSFDLWAQSLALCCFRLRPRSSLGIISQGSTAKPKIARADSPRSKSAATVAEPHLASAPPLGMTRPSCQRMSEIR